MAESGMVGIYRDLLSGERMLQVYLNSGARVWAVDLAEAEGSVVPSLSCHIGGNWVNLPVLTCLELYAGRKRTVIDRDLLTPCSNLIEVSFVDGTLEYKCRDIKSIQPAHLLNLELLDLIGWPSCTFHPETLHSTGRLKNLSITSNAFNNGEDIYSLDHFDNFDDFTDCNYFISPINELYQSYGIQGDSSTTLLMPAAAIIRPKWTWDWYLPHLVLIKLSSEFAFLFQFRMLQGCPALQFLEFEVRTPTSSHTRTITNTDMFTPSLDAIIASSFTKLRMNGSWTFKDPSMAYRFLTRMFPCLESLSAIGWVGLVGSSPIDQSYAQPGQGAALGFEQSVQQGENERAEFSQQGEGGQHLDYLLT
ncbi:hypothetical protein BG015_011937 [Linnemannia schmuckeri]|uniref:Uncharacterized protein n=1 Tax=Linnemannia schmuckeri TaxID=64567 RepID=A0A9P5RRW1_9FUNG|nr:hypothetical protein BG015_011937 [Linnemannia schmuckeri]